jgi:hypothetical protein
MAVTRVDRTDKTEYMIHLVVSKERVLEVVKALRETLDPERASGGSGGAK